MALATPPDVVADLGRALTASEELRAPSLLAKASAIVVGYCGTDFEPAPYPDAVVAVVAGMVGRVFTTDAAGLANIEQQNAGPWGVRYATGSTSSAPWLSAGDKLALKIHRRGGGLTSVQLVSQRYSAPHLDEDFDEGA